MPTTSLTITGCILARNEARRIEAAIQSLLGWTEQVIVLDNESGDDTAAIAHRYTEHVFTVPPSEGPSFDGLRNRAIDLAIGDWIFYLDADERVPERLGQALRQLLQERGGDFEALVVPFRHFFCGAWVRNSFGWPGYTRPQLLKKGCFRNGERVHSGVEVQGRTLYFPASDPELAIIHYSYDDLHHYLEKLNRYTDGEAESLLADGHSHSWQAMLAHFVHDWQAYYDLRRAGRDGMHGFVLAFFSAFYRFASRAKLWDLRRQRGDLLVDEPLPLDLREMLEFMAQVVQQGAEPWTQVPSAPPTLRGSNPVVPLLWKAPLFDPSGYADEARTLVLALIEAGEPLSVAPERWGGGEAGLDPAVLSALEERIAPAETAAELFVSHTLAVLQAPPANADFAIARTMFETDRLPAIVPERLNGFDRIWVPSEFNRETFVRSGVDPAKIAVIPGALDAAPFAAEVEPWPVPGDEAFRFLSVFDWMLHKGWDVLLEAFAREFGDDPRVGLILKTWSSNHRSMAAIRAEADTFLRQRLGRGLESFPNIHLWEERLPAADLPRLYRAVHAYVTPTRGEGWCRPLMEAMAAGLPTIATAWSGLTAFHNARVGYSLQYRLMPVSEAGAREVPVYTGHCWAEPDAAELRRLMRQVVANPEAARRKGRAAQKEVAKHYSRRAVAATLQEELRHCRELSLARGTSTAECQPSTPPVPAVARPALPPPTRARPAPQRASLPTPFKPPANPLLRDAAEAVNFCQLLGRPLRVRWEGDQSILSSLALVNREFCLGLLASGDAELTLIEHGTPWHTLSGADDPRFKALFARRDAALSGRPDVTVRHHFPPNWQRPETGRLVVMQPWEYAYLPRAWVAGARQADEVWAYSRFVRDVYARSGVPAEKVRVVPLGVDTACFTPERRVYPLLSQKSIRFLFVGGALDRKGADLLLHAYLRAFGPNDDVCLVVKDMGTRTFYQRQTLGDAFRQAQWDSNAPSVIYRDEDMAGDTLASLYRACTCVVLPYRGEGFGLPPLEGMACGIPAIVTAGGSTDDYCDDTTALRLPARRRSRPDRSVGPFACAGDPWEFDPDPDALVAALRWVRDHPDEVRRRGEAAREYVVANWSWSRAVADLRSRLRELVAPAEPRVSASTTPWHDPITKTAAALVSSTEGGSLTGERRLPNRAERRRSGRKGPLSAASGSRAVGGGRPAPTISLCLIARDEERCLRECLESIRPYVDEMVVVDTGSSDRTREIAREWGARVFEFPWCDDFAAARNASLDQARGDWIFWMDADDVISPECGRQLRELVAQYANRDVAFQMPVQILPKPGQFSPQRTDHVKLFPNRADLRFEHRIHEQILPSVRRAGLQLIYSDLYVVHRNYDTSEAGQQKKRLRDFRLLELDLKDRPDHPFVLFNLGMTYLHATKDFEVAAQYLRRSLDRSDPNDSIVHIAYAMLTTCRVHQADWEAAIQVNEEGRHYHPEDPELLFLAGQIYQQVGRFDEARDTLERLITGRDDPRYRTGDVGLRTYRGWHELGLLFRRMGDPPHCLEVLRRLQREYPFYLPAQLDLAETLVICRELPTAREVLSSIGDAPEIHEEVARLADLLRHAEGERTQAGIAPENRDADCFEFGGRRYPYFRHGYNGAGSNERTVEVALALAALEQADAPTKRVLEVGHVLGHYGATGHTVVDRYETGDGVVTADIAEYVPAEPFDLIVSISTLEHLGWDEEPKEPEKVERVLTQLANGMLAPGGRLLATVPMGYNPHLDRLILEDRTGLRVSFLRRLNEANEWEEVERAAIGHPEYGQPFPHANVVAVLTR
jgi:glycosyltransferase involved in cell wall biosynthesis/tetratricopeptide (TPR) repeat protein